MKKLIQNFARRLGYDIHKLPETPDDGIVYPYIEKFTFESGLSFEYWITNPEFRDWYLPSKQAGWHETRAYQTLIEQGDGILEVGCNNGFTMCLMKSIAGPNVRYVGMDVILSNCQAANSQIGLNCYTNSHIIHAAASDVRGKVSVFNANNGFVTSEHIKNLIAVDAFPCDELITRFGYFDLLKIDVEGYEGNVLKGCRALLTKKPKIIIELHGSQVEQFKSSYDEIFRLIGIERYDGFMCLRDDNEMRAFDPELLVRQKPHVTLFIHKRP